MRELPIQMTKDYHRQTAPKRSSRLNRVLFVAAFLATFGVALAVLNLLS